jgi:Family of unknown function (DUF6325)
MTASLEYLIVGFPDNDFSGEIVPGLLSLVDAGLIRVVDLVFVAKGDDGSVIVLEVDEHEHLSAFLAIKGSVGGVIGPDDIDHAAESISDGSSVLLIVWEDLWAAPFGDAVRRAGGVFIEGGRIPAEIAQEVESVLADAG